MSIIFRGDPSIVYLDGVCPPKQRSKYKDEKETKEPDSKVTGFPDTTEKKKNGNVYNDSGLAMAIITHNPNSGFMVSRSLLKTASSGGHQHTHRIMFLQTITEDDRESR